MPDPLTAVGGTVAILQIAIVIGHFGCELGKCIRSVRHAQCEIQSISLELFNFSSSLRIFHMQSSTWFESLSESSEKESRKEHIASLIRECRIVEGEFNEMLSRFFLVESGGRRKVDQNFNRIGWYFRRIAVRELKLSLESAKSSVALFVTLHICEDL